MQRRPASGWFCDLCMSSFAEGGAATAGGWRCAQGCSFDVCDACYSAPGRRGRALKASQLQGAALRVRSSALLMALDRNHASTVAMALLDACPATAGLPNREGDYPLHAAVARGSDASVVRHLLAAHRGAAASKSSKGLPPLHAAITAGASVEVVEALAAADPAALLLPIGPAAHLPLHLVFFTGCRRSGFRPGDRVRLADEYRDTHGTGPTDIGVVTAVSSDEDRPFTVKWEDSGGPWTYRPDTLLGCASLQPEKTRRLAEALLAASPTAAATPDACGRLALHLAAAGSASPELISVLIQAHPAAATTYDGGEPPRLPLTTALLAGSLSADAIEALLVADRGLLLREIVRRQEYAQVVYNVVKRFPGCAYDSVYSDGRCAAEIAEGECRVQLREALYLLGRYKLERSPVHVSDTCAVILATDFSHNRRRVALKGMRNEEQFRREIESRSSGAGGASLDERFVLPILGQHKDGVDGGVFGWEGPAYVLVLERAKEDLAASIAHGGIKTLPAARDVARSLGLCLAYLHENGLIHGDVKPLNVISIAAVAAADGDADGGAGGPGQSDAGPWRIIDLDAASPAGNGFVGLKCSTAYAPPELLFRDECAAGASRAVRVDPGAGSAGAVATETVHDKEANMTWHFLEDGTILKLRGGQKEEGGGALSVFYLPRGAGWSVRRPPAVLAP